MIPDALFFAVVDRGKAGDLLHWAREKGVAGGTIFAGEGTNPSPILSFLGISEVHKEVLMLGVTQDLSQQLFTAMKDEFRMDKRYKGIAFVVPFRQWLPDAPPKGEGYDRAKQPPFVCLITIVDKGKGELLMEVARKAGARGGTIVHAHGAGVPQDIYFPLLIEPQKDMVFIVDSRVRTQPIQDAIYREMGLEEQNKGIVIALPVLRTIGLYQPRSAGNRGRK
ncbi:MAG: hypothetical protein PHP07_10550 [Eubacteriales bacterium]|nr:hypothetical protein [Eubacteriales bacterium]MDD3573367.1 hypothetical protein [Eubacteriales bacterium]